MKVYEIDAEAGGDNTAVIRGSENSATNSAVVVGGSQNGKDFTHSDVLTGTANAEERRDDQPNNPTKSK